MRRDEADPLLPPREVGRDRAGDVDREEPLEPQEPPRVVDEPSRGRRIRAGLEDRPGREAEEEYHEEDDGELEGCKGADELVQGFSPFLRRSGGRAERQLSFTSEVEVSRRQVPAVPRSDRFNWADPRPGLGKQGREQT